MFYTLTYFNFLWFLKSTNTNTYIHTQSLTHTDTHNLIHILKQHTYTCTYLHTLINTYSTYGPIKMKSKDRLLRIDINLIMVICYLILCLKESEHSWRKREQLIRIQLDSEFRIWKYKLKIIYIYSHAVNKNTIILNKDTPVLKWKYLQSGRNLWMNPLCWNGENFQKTSCVFHWFWQLLGQGILTTTCSWTSFPVSTTGKLIWLYWRLTMSPVCSSRFPCVLWQRKKQVEDFPFKPMMFWRSYATICHCTHITDIPTISRFWIFLWSSNQNYVSIPGVSLSQQ